MRPRRVQGSGASGSARWYIEAKEDTMQLLKQVFRLLLVAFSVLFPLP